MKSARVQHSKYKNTGILFELLARQVTADTLNGREQSPALEILREYFNPSTELGKELSLYRSLIDATRLSDARAIKFLDLVVEQRRRINTKKLNEQKYRLVKAIKDAYPLKEFLAAKIPQYKVYASIYKTFLSEAKPHRIDVSDISDVASARFTIVEHMGSDKKGDADASLTETVKSQQEDLRLLTYKILVDKFNDKYKNLDERQKKLLREYINNVSNTNSLREYVNGEVPGVKSELQSRIRRVDDKVIRIKLQEVVHQLDSIKRGKTVRDSQVAALMIAYQMVKEIDSVCEA